MNVLGNLWVFAGVVFSVLCIIYAMIPRRSPRAEAWRELVTALAGFSVAVFVFAFIMAVVALPIIRIVRWFFK
jgi:amino acid transporter